MLQKLRMKEMSKLKKRLILLTSGTFIAQIINIGLTPVITRIYSPSEYGVISVFTSVLLLFTLLGTLNYELAIPIAKDDREAVNIIVISFITLFISSCFLFLILFFIGDQILVLLNAEKIKDYKYTILLGVVVISVYSVLTQWALRKKLIYDLSQTKITQAVFQNVITICLGLLKLGPLGLIIGKIIGQSAGILRLGKPLYDPKKELYNKVSYINIKASFKRYKNFPLYTTPRRVIGDLTISLPALVLTGMFGLKYAGYFALANSIVQLPLNIVGTSVGQIFYSEVASLKNKDAEKVLLLSKKFIIALLSVGLLPLIALLFFGEEIFTLIFGIKWSVAGEMASILSISIFLKFIITPISSIFDIYEEQKSALILHGSRLIFISLAFWICYIFDLNIYITLTLYSIIISLLYFVQYFLARMIIKKNNK